MAEQIQGRVERITFHNEENGYSILKLKTVGRRDPVTVIGSFVAVSAGESLRLTGAWSNHPKYGEQFKCDRYESLAPATLDGIRRYLGSGLIKGIGPEMAKRIVKLFGEQTLDVIDQDPERLRQVEGIGPTRIERIRKAWEEQKEIREVMVFLQSHGVSAGYAAKIFKHYGKASLRILHENPYRMAMEIYGIGFLTADRIAQQLGFALDSPVRAEAGLHYVLFQATEAGHVCVPEGELLRQGGEILQIEPEILGQALPRLATGGRIIRQAVPGPIRDAFGDPFAIYLRGYYQAETQIAQRFRRQLAIQSLRRVVDLDRAITWLRSRLPFQLAALQEEAVRRSLTANMVIITGGPGTGKTTLVQAIVAVYRRMEVRIALAAPTGRAAKRLHEATRHNALTIHRLLEFSPQQGGFQRNERNPLNADLIIVDEASMLDCLLMHHLLKAIPGRATLVLVGDVDQLPSVGAGSVLQDLIDCDRFPVVRLTEIFRQARQSRIVTNAHRVRMGQFPSLQSDPHRLTDFYFIEKEQPEEVLAIILKLCRDRIPKRFGLDPVDDIQVLSPMNRGTIGVHRLNEELQRVFNPRGPAVERGGRILRLHDKVMQIRNNYDKDVFNGDLGRIRAIDLENQELKVEVDGRLVTYDFSELDELVLAYAVSVHKAQGSEYPAVVIPVATQHYMMLQRNLIYTAITRGRKLVVLVGSKKALAMAVRNDKTSRRHTLLKERLTGALKEASPLDALTADGHQPGEGQPVR